MRIIRGKYGRRRFDVPKNITARPTTDFARENIFNVLENRDVIEGSKVLDLFAGTGAVSWEFVSRGAEMVTSVEEAPVQSRFILSVKEKLGDKVLRLVRGDVFLFLDRNRTSYDIVFADAPYQHERFGEIPELIMKSESVHRGTLVIVEHSSKYDFSQIAGFQEKRSYGSVNFSMFIVGGETDDSAEKEEIKDPENGQ